MTALPVDEALSRDSFRAALRAIRKRRGLRAADVAARLSMPLRSYEYFESGAGQPNLDRVFQFAEATDSDAWAILLGAACGRPDLAVRCADNKLVTVFMMAVQDFDDDLGDEIPDVETAILIARFSAVFRDLADYARARRRDADDWLARPRRAAGEDEQ